LPGYFTHKGSLEEIASENSALKTHTDSLADSSIYNELIEDMEGFMQYYEKDKKKAEDVTSL